MNLAAKMAVRFGLEFKPRRRRHDARNIVNQGITIRQLKILDDLALGPPHLERLAQHTTGNPTQPRAVDSLVKRIGGDDDRRRARPIGARHVDIRQSLRLIIVEIGPQRGGYEIGVQAIELLLGQPAECFQLLPVAVDRIAFLLPLLQLKLHDFQDLRNIVESHQSGRRDVFPLGTAEALPTGPCCMTARQILRILVRLVSKFLHYLQNAFTGSIGHPPLARQRLRHRCSGDANLICNIFQGDFLLFFQGKPLILDVMSIFI